MEEQQSQQLWINNNTTTAQQQTRNELNTTKEDTTNNYEWFLLTCLLFIRLTSSKNSNCSSIPPIFLMICGTTRCSNPIHKVYTIKLVSPGMHRVFFHLFSLTLTWHVLLPVIDLIYSIICFAFLNNSDLEENTLKRLSTQRVLPHRHPRLTLAVYFIHVNWEHTTSSPHQVTWLVS